MEDYENDYAKIVNFQPSYPYHSAESEARRIQKCTILKNEDVHYGNIIYSIDSPYSNKNSKVSKFNK